MMKSYVKIISLLLAFLVAGLLLGYVVSNNTNSAVVFSEEDFSELFVNVDSEIIIYTLPDCVFCHQLKGFLDEHQVQFDERSVADHPEYREQVARLGSDRVPVLITESFMIQGFIESEVIEILIQKGYIAPA